MSGRSTEKVKCMLDDIEFSKATGFNNIPPKLFKSASQELAQTLTTFVNQSINLYHLAHALRNGKYLPCTNAKVISHKLSPNWCIDVAI